MSIFQHPLLLVFLSFLVCPVASQTGQKVKEVNSGLCTGAELIGTAADCQAAAKVLGLGGTVGTESSVNSPPGCIWGHWGGYDRFFFNTNNASTTACGSGSYPFMCLCNQICCHAKEIYSWYEKDCNTIPDAAACSGRLHHLKNTCDWNCGVTAVVDMTMYRTSTLEIRKSRIVVVL